MFLHLPKYHLEVHDVSGEDIPLADALFRKCYPDTFLKLSRKMENHVHSIIFRHDVRHGRLNDIRSPTDQDEQFHKLEWTLYMVLLKAKACATQMKLVFCPIVRH